jgi:hypothetical protein
VCDRGRVRPRRLPNRESHLPRIRPER